MTESNTLIKLQGGNIALLCTSKQCIILPYHGSFVIILAEISSDYVLLLRGCDTMVFWLLLRHAPIVGSFLIVTSEIRSATESPTWKFCYILGLKIATPWVNYPKFTPISGYIGQKSNKNPLPRGRIGLFLSNIIKMSFLLTIFI